MNKRIIYLRIFGFFLCAILLFTPSRTFSIEHSLHVHFINVGYGDAILIEFPNSKTMMVDAGDKLYQLKVLEYLKAKDIQKLDDVIITHPHKNHFDGFTAISDAMPIERVMINGDMNGEEGYEDLLAGLENKSIASQILQAGQEINIEDSSIEITVLHPDNLSASGNGNSIVLLLKYNNVSFLFMGDIEPQQQDALFDKYDILKDVNVIKVPHHGGPLSERFKEIFQDKLYVVSTGVNDWNNPRLDDYADLNGVVLSTQEHGDILIESDGEQYKVIKY